MTASAEPPRKGIRKVNISDLAGSLSSKGKPPYKDDDLLSMYRDCLNDEGSVLVWEKAVITANTDQTITAEKAKWRNRAVSVFAQLNIETHTLTVKWTDKNECVLIPVKKS